MAILRFTSDTQPFLDSADNASRIKILPPIVALILCTVFVLVLLRLEHNQFPKMTRALWVPTIWMLYTASKPLSSWFRLSGDPESGSPVDRAFLIILMCMALWTLARRKYRWNIALKNNTWLIVLIIYMLISILWSDLTYISFKRWVREFQAVLMAFVVNSEPSPRQAIESIFRKTSYILIPFSLLLIRYFPAYGVAYNWSGFRSWIGVTLQKNGLGRLCLISAFFLIWSLVRRLKEKNQRIWKYQTYADAFVLLLALYLLKGSGEYSATSVTALGAGLLFYLGLYLIKKFRINLRAGTLVTILGIIIIFGIVSVFVGGSNLRFFVSSVNRDSTLTGRAEIWGKLLPLAMQRPLLGRGFGSFWTSSMKKAIASEAHSGYFDVLLDIGFVGSFLVSMFLFSACTKATRELKHDFDWGVLWICFIIMAAVHNITETSINSLTTHLTAVILFLSVSLTSINLPRKPI